MGFEIIRSDITKQKVQAIVNSVGYITSSYGAICRAILKATNYNAELKSIIDGKNGQVKIGDIFETDGYGLPAKHIIHLITPFEYDDPNMAAFETAVRDLLVYCRKHGYLNIAIPILGTGYNHYKHIEVENMLMSMASSFANIYEDMNITIVKKSTGIPDDASEMDISNYEYERQWVGQRKFEDAMRKYYLEKNLQEIREERDYDQAFFEASGPVLPLGWIKKATTASHKTVRFTDAELNKIDDAYDYINKYLDKRYGTDEIEKELSLENVKMFITKGSGSKSKESSVFYDFSIKQGKNPPRKKLFLAALALETNEEEALRFMSFFGAAPKTHDAFEQSIMKCIRLGIYDINGIDDQLADKHLGSLFPEK